MNLREDKGWAYGARSAIQNTQAQRPFLVQASVQTDKTAESIIEVHKELSMIIDNSPVTQEELSTSLDKRILTLPGRWETAGAVLSDIASMVRYKLDDDYWDKYVKELNNIDLSQVNQVAKKFISPDQMLWLVVGDRSKVEQAIRDTNLGTVIILNNEGERVN